MSMNHELLITRLHCGATQLPGQAPSSPDYVPGPEHLSLPDYVPRREYPEYLVPSDDEAPIEDQPLLADASPTALSPSYVANFDMEEDPEEDPVDYPADGGEEELEEESSGMMLMARMKRRPLRMRTTRRSI
ncbi:hypothetical protein Tco_0613803 [Tanacetum coccineum]